MSSLPYAQLYARLNKKQQDEVKRTFVGTADQVVRESLELYRMFDEPTDEERKETEDFLEKLYSNTVGPENVERIQRGDREVVTIAEPESTAARVARDIGSFGVSLMGVGKITAPLKSFKAVEKVQKAAPKTTKTASSLAQAEVATQLSINPYEENLANVIGNLIDDNNQGLLGDIETYMLNPIKSSQEKTELQNRIGLLSTGIGFFAGVEAVRGVIRNKDVVLKPFLSSIDNIKNKGTKASQDFINTIKDKANITKRKVDLDTSRIRLALKKRKEDVKEQKQQLSLFEPDDSAAVLGDIKALREGFINKFSTIPVVRNVSNALAKTFTTRGGRSKMLHEKYLKARYTNERWEATIDHVGRNLEEAIINIHKGFDIPIEDAWKKVNEILFSNYKIPKEKGYTLGTTQEEGFNKALQTLPPSTREPIRKARELQDTLSRLLLQSDSIPDSKKEDIAEQLGFYVRRSWRLYDDVGYKPSTKATLDAEAFIEQEIRKSNPNISEDELVNKVAAQMELLAGGKGEFANFSKSFDAFNKLQGDIIKERQVIPPAIRAYLGEIESPTEKLLISMKKISKFVSDSKFHNQAWKDGKNIYFFDSADAVKGFSFQIPKAVGDDVVQPYGNLSGKYTSENLGQYYTSKYEKGLLINDEKSSNWMIEAGKNTWRSLLWLKSQSQKSKTVRRINTHIKNVFGGAQISGANGFSMLNPTQLRKAFQTLKVQLSKNTDLENQAYLEELSGYGILNKNAVVNDLKNLANEASQATYNPLSRPATYLKETKAGKTLVNLDEKAQDLYIAEDDLWKINMFELEKIHIDKFNKSLPNNVKFDKYKYNDVGQEAANLTRNGLPNYDLVPENIRALRSVPFVGKFFSFLSESMRLGITIPNQSFKELALARTLAKEGATKASNIMLKRGMDRAVGYSTFAVGGGYAVANIANYAWGVTYDTINNIRPFLPQFMQNDTLVYTKNEDGDSIVYNLTPWDAFDFPRKGFQTAIHIAANRDLTEQEQRQFVVDFFNESLEPFFGEAITQEAIRAYVTGGKDANGRLLKNPYNPRERFDDSGEWIENVTNLNNLYIFMANIVEDLEPGTITDIRRFAKTWGKEQTEFDQDIYPKQALARLITGFSGMPMNEEYIKNVYSIEAGKFKKQKEKSRNQIYRGISDDATMETFTDQWLDANRIYYKSYERLHNLTKKAENLGISKDFINDELSKAGVSKAEQVSFRGEQRFFNPIGLTEGMVEAINKSTSLSPFYFDIVLTINSLKIELSRLPVLVPLTSSEVDEVFERQETQEPVLTERTKRRISNFKGGEVSEENPVPNAAPEPSERINPYTGQPYEAEMERLGFAEGGENSFEGREYKPLPPEEEPKWWEFREQLKNKLKDAGVSESKTRDLFGRNPNEMKRMNELRTDAGLDPIEGFVESIPFVLGQVDALLGVTSLPAFTKTAGSMVPPYIAMAGESALGFTDALKGVQEFPEDVEKDWRYGVSVAALPLTALGGGMAASRFIPNIKTKTPTKVQNTNNDVDKTRRNILKGTAAAGAILSTPSILRPLSKAGSKIKVAPAAVKTILDRIPSGEELTKKTISNIPLEKLFQGGRQKFGTSNVGGGKAVAKTVKQKTDTILNTYGLKEKDMNILYDQMEIKGSGAWDKFTSMDRDLFADGVLNKKEKLSDNWTITKDGGFADTASDANPLDLPQQTDVMSLWNDALDTAIARQNISREIEEGKFRLETYEMMEGPPLRVPRLQGLSKEDRIDTIKKIYQKNPDNLSRSTRANKKDINRAGDLFYTRDYTARASGYEADEFGGKGAWIDDLKPIETIKTPIKITDDNRGIYARKFGNETTYGGDWTENFWNPIFKPPSVTLYQEIFEYQGIPIIRITERLDRAGEGFSSYDSVLLIPNKKGMEKLTGKDRIKKQYGGLVGNLQKRKAMREGGDAETQESFSNQILKTIQQNRNWSDEETAILNSFANLVGYAESDNQADRLQDSGGPGRGMYQYEIGESQGASTGRNRFFNFAKDNNINVPEEYLGLLGEQGPTSIDFSKLPEDLQTAIFYADKAKHPEFSLNDLVSGKLSFEDAWADYHWAGDPTEREAKVDYFLRKNNLIK